MKHTRTPIASAVALVLLGAVAAAHAQTATAKPELGTVTVTGIRASLEQSINQKRNADSVVEVITSEDIGKMPDKNVADSLQRVPGVTIGAASGGEGGFDENDRVSLRGTNPSLTQTMINGHMVGSGDWFVLNQVGNVGRSVSYSLLPSQIVGAVVVQKSAQADLVEGGIAGTIDIRTRKPLEFKKPFTAEAQVGMVYSDLPEKSEPQLSGLINWKNDSNTVGVMVQAFSEKRSLRRDGQEMLGFGNKIEAGSPIAVANPSLSGAAYPNFIGSSYFLQTRKREGAMVDVQVKPTNDLELDLSLFNSKMDAGSVNRNILFWQQNILKNGNGQAPNPGYVVKNGTLVAASFSPVAGNVYGLYDQIARPNAQSSTGFTNLDVAYRVNDALKVKAKLGSSKGEGITPEQALLSGTIPGTGGSYQLNGISRPADVNFGSADITKSSLINGIDWIYGASPAKTTDSERWGQIDAQYALGEGLFSSLKFGARSATHERSTDVVSQGPLWSADPFNAANLPPAGGAYPGNFGSGLGGGAFPRNPYIVDEATLIAWGRKFSNREPISRRNWGAEFAITETNRAGYLMGNFESGSWSGNVGVRMVESKSNVLTNVAIATNPSGNPATPNDCAALATCSVPGAITSSAFGAFYQKNIENTHSDVLPSLNLRLDVAKDIVGRFALAKTLSRPDYGVLGGAVSLNDSTKTGSGGNPNLKPITSTNVDVGVEWYYQPRALLSAGVYSMDLQNYVAAGTSRAVYKNIKTGLDEVYTISSPVNSSGSVSGFELAIQQPLPMGFGVFGNYTYADAKEVGDKPLFGASKNTYNVGGYFENDTWNMRLSYTYRSSFYASFDRGSPLFQDETGTLAGSLGYKVNDKLSITLDALNLNNPTLKYYAASTDQPVAFYNNGRQYYINARIKF